MRTHPTQRISQVLFRGAIGAFIPSIAAVLFAVSSHAAATFQEAGGRVVIEAEHFDSRTAASDGQHWQVYPDEGPIGATPVIANARGSYVVSLPDSPGGGNNHNVAGDEKNPPNIDYKFKINTAGTYRFWMRWVGYDGSSDSIYARIVEVPSPGWYRCIPVVTGTDFNGNWNGNGAAEVNDAGGGELPTSYTLDAGTYTLEINMREDGSSVDTIMLQLDSMPDPTDPGPAESGLAAGFLIGTQPGNQITTPGKTATFTVTPLLPPGGTATYQWQQKAPAATGFTDVSGATSQSYTTPATTDTMNGTQYRVVAASGGSSITSAAATLITDATPPTIVGAFGGSDLKSVTIRFSEKLDKTSAETASNYTANGLTLTNPKLQANGTDVILATTAQSGGTNYSVTINGVKDIAGNGISNGQAKFAGAVSVAGSVLHKFWNNINVNTPATLRADPRFPDSPTFITVEPRFEYPPNGGNEAGSTYGNTLSGWIVPPVTGDYVFFTCSDDLSDLFLSTDDNPANKKLIAQETVWSNPRQWTSSGGGSDLTAKRSDQFSASEWPTPNVITLTAGKQYYMEVQHTEGGGGDNVSVNWIQPGGSDPTDGDPPIDGSFVRILADPTATITFTQQPSNQTVTASLPVSFSVGFTAFSAYGTNATIQWQRAPSGSSTFTDVTNATGSIYNIAFAGPSDNGAQYRAVVSASATKVNSAPATLTVGTDSTPPSVTAISANTTTIKVAFSEPIDATSGAAKANYSLSGGATVSSATVTSASGQAGGVTLAATGLNAGQTYTLTITGVKDLSGNAVAAGTTRSFTVYNISENFDDGQVPAGAAIAVAGGSGPGTAVFVNGAFQLTPYLGSSVGSMVFADPLNGGSATKFTATFKLFLGVPSGDAADGFSFCIGPDIAGDPTAPTAFGEDGTGSGFRASFDTYDNGGGEAPAISIFWQGQETTIKTNLPKPTLVNGQWVDVAIQVTADGKVTLIHNNIKYFDNVQIDGWAPIDAPQVGLGARTGGVFETAQVDDLKVLFNADVALPQPPTISITAPTPDQQITANAPFTITVDAKDPENQVAKVEFFVNGQKLGESTTAPYSFSIPAVPQGAYYVTAKVTDAQGLSVTSSGVKAVSGNPDKVYFVTADPGPLTFAGDQAVFLHVLNRGYNVVLARGSDVPNDGSTAAGSVLILQSSSLGSGTVEIADPAGGPIGVSKFKDLNIPAIEWEASNQDGFGFQETNGLTTASQTDINIVDANSPLAAGLSTGPHTVVTAPDTFSQGVPKGAHVVATLTADPTQAVIYDYDKGEKGFNDFVMPARRVFFFFQDNTAAGANADGWKLFDAAVDWAVGKTNSGGGAPVIAVAPGTGNTLSISWTNGGTLQSNDDVTNKNTWVDVSSTSPTPVTVNKPHIFYRVKK